MAAERRADEDLVVGWLVGWLAVRDGFDGRRETGPSLAQLTPCPPSAQAASLACLSSCVLFSSCNGKVRHACLESTRRPHLTYSLRNVLEGGGAKGGKELLSYPVMFLLPQPLFLFMLAIVSLNRETVPVF